MRTVDALNKMLGSLHPVGLRKSIDAANPCLCEMDADYESLLNVVLVLCWKREYLHTPNWL
jgi:hypothetical protein